MSPSIQVSNVVKKEPTTNAQSALPLMKVESSTTPNQSAETSTGPVTQNQVNAEPQVKTEASATSQIPPTGVAPVNTQPKQPVVSTAAATATTGNPQAAPNVSQNPPPSATTPTSATSSNAKNVQRLPPIWKGHLTWKLRSPKPLLLKCEVMIHPLRVNNKVYSAED
jgi:cell division protein FtsN